MPVQRPLTEAERRQARQKRRLYWVWALTAILIIGSLLVSLLTY